MPEATLTINLQGPTPGEPLSIYQLGQSFYLAGNRCSLNIEVGPGITQSLTSPSVVNYCFAIELFCKTLIQAQNTKPKKIHKLDQLFRAIPHESQEKVAVLYSQAVQDPALPTLLQQTADYFQQVRYGYEFNIFTFQEFPLATLAKSLYVHCTDALEVSSSVRPIHG